MHLHSPSEHTFAGGFYAAEAHMVHYNSASNTYIVLGIMLDVAGGDNRIIPYSNNTLLQTLWDAAGTNLLTETAVTVTSTYTLNPYDTLLPPLTSHFRYSGSFTTPPCTESVEWFVYEQPVRISADDLRIIRLTGLAYGSESVVSAEGNSNRFPLPDLGKRTVYYVSQTSSESSTTATDDDDDSSDNDKDNKMAYRIAIAAIVLAAVSVTAILIIFFLLCKFNLLKPQSSEIKEQSYSAVTTNNP
jgi:hypothetical protein